MRLFIILFIVKSTLFIYYFRQIKKYVKDTLPFQIGRIIGKIKILYEDYPTDFIAGVIIILIVIGSLIKGIFFH